MFNLSKRFRATLERSSPMFSLEFHTRLAKQRREELLRTASAMRSLRSLREAADFSHQKNQCSIKRRKLFGTQNLSPVCSTLHTSKCTACSYPLPNGLVLV